MYIYIYSTHVVNQIKCACNKLNTEILHVIMSVHVHGTARIHVCLILTTKKIVPFIFNFSYNLHPETDINVVSTMHINVQCNLYIKKYSCSLIYFILSF